MRRAIPLLLFALLTAGCERPTRQTAPVPGRADLHELLVLVGRRLDVMHDVARAKWNARAPVQDSARERQLLDDVAARAKARGLDADFTRSFFAAQMEAARLVQEDDLRQWRAEQRAPFAEAPDLAALRRRIDAINGDLLAALAAARPFLESAEGQRLLEQEAGTVLAGVPGAVRDAALRPLRRP